ncbi:MAG: SufE family protein [Bacteroidota bacterium]
MPTELDARQQAIVDEFAMLDDWMLRYQHLIEHARSMPELPEADRTDDALVRGCQSRVWIQTRDDDGRFHLAADSEAQIVRGLASLLVRALDGLPPRTVAEADLWFVREAGLSEHLSPNRANGLDAMIRRIRQEAAAASVDRTA